MTYDPTDPESLQTLRAKQKEQATKNLQQSEDDFLWIMKSVRGRRFVWDLLEQSGVFRTTYQPLMRDVPTEMAFREGVKTLGYQLLARIQALCPEKYVQMVKEHQDGRNKSDA